MIVKLSDYVVSPLAMGTHANYECVKAGKTALRKYVNFWNLAEPFVASMMDDSRLVEACCEAGISVDLFTKFEQMAILAAFHALKGTEIMPDDNNVLFILATTKGNVELLDERCEKKYLSNRLLLTETARCIARWFRNSNEPLVVCNACVSGLSAQMEAIRALESGCYKYAIVIGADVLSPFIVSGFQSLKALSANLCRPFDEERIGLNLGEAAACIIYGHAEVDDRILYDSWSVISSANRNDAYHISSPSKKAEGAYRALNAVFKDPNIPGIAFVNVHGTATMFNDEMEAVAIHRMGLESLPINGLKGYFGHTLGASGILETLISMEALDDNTVLATKGFEQLGVSRSVNLSQVHCETHGTAFLKMMAGFGGCNVAMLFGKGRVMENISHSIMPRNLDIVHTVHLTESEVIIDGKAIQIEGYGMSMLKYLYHTYVKDYPKFYKMDPLCKLGFIGTELLLEAEAKADHATRFFTCEDRAIVFVGRSGSLCADEIYQQTIQDPDNYYPSPLAFIYTLPNILTGEIAIRNNYHGETLYLLQDTSKNVKQLITQVLYSQGTRSVIGGWIDVKNINDFEATLYIIK